MGLVEYHIEQTTKAPQLVLEEEWQAIQDIIEEYEDVFTGIGKLKVVTVELHVEPNAPGAMQKQRRVPLPLTDKQKRKVSSNYKTTSLAKCSPLRESCPIQTKVAALQGPPESQAEVRSFLFFAGANADFMEDFTQIMAPLRSLIKEGVEFQ